MTPRPRPRRLLAALAALPLLAGTAHADLCYYVWYDEKTGQIVLHQDPTRPWRCEFCVPTEEIIERICEKTGIQCPTPNLTTPPVPGGVGGGLPDPTTDKRCPTWVIAYLLDNGWSLAQQTYDKVDDHLPPDVAEAGRAVLDQIPKP